MTEQQPETATNTPWEPPFAGTEVEALLGALDRQRWTFRYKAGDLDAAGLSATIGASSLTLGGLLKHLAANEDYLVSVKLSGAPMPEAWQDNGWDGDDDWEFTSAADDTPETLYALYDGAVARARALTAAAIADGGLDQRCRPPTATATTPTCDGSCSTCSRSTAATPATPTSSGRRSTDAWARTRRPDGAPDGDHMADVAQDDLTVSDTEAELDRHHGRPAHFAIPVVVGSGSIPMGCRVWVVG